MVTGKKLKTLLAGCITLAALCGMAQSAVAENTQAQQAQTTVVFGQTAEQDKRTGKEMFAEEREPYRNNSALETAAAQVISEELKKVDPELAKLFDFNSFKKAEHKESRGRLVLTYRNVQTNFDPSVDRSTEQIEDTFAKIGLPKFEWKKTSGQDEYIPYFTFDAKLDNLKDSGLLEKIFAKAAEILQENAVEEQVQDAPAVEKAPVVKTAPVAVEASKRPFSIGEMFVNAAEYGSDTALSGLLTVTNDEDYNTINGAFKNFKANIKAGFSNGDVDPNEAIETLINELGAIAPNEKAQLKTHLANIAQGLRDEQQKEAPATSAEADKELSRLAKFSKNQAEILLDSMSEVAIPKDLAVFFMENYENTLESAKDNGEEAAAEFRKVFGTEEAKAVLDRVKAIAYPEKEKPPSEEANSVKTFDTNAASKVADFNLKTTKAIAEKGYGV